MIAARAPRFSCGPMSGFDNAKMDAAFSLPGRNGNQNFICNLGYGDASKLHPRAPRLAFDEDLQGGLVSFNASHIRLLTGQSASRKKDYNLHAEQMLGASFNQNCPLPSAVSYFDLEGGLLIEAG